MDFNTQLLAAQMDEYNIEKTILCSAGAHLNEELNKAWREMPERIAPLCWVNANLGQQAYDMLEHYLRDEGFAGVMKSLWIALACRILLGVIAGWLWNLIKKLKLHDWAALPITAAIATICHTLLVMGSIYVLLAQQYAAAKNVAVTAVFGLVMGTVTASGIPEAIAAAVLVTVIGKALLHLMARLSKH